MNVEVYSYSILASILGISVVFLVLVGLCLLMILLKKVFDEKEKPAPAAAVPAGGAPAAAVSAPAANSSLWLMAAVAAYLEEESSGAPRAGSWVRAYAEVSDPWMNRATFDKTLS